VAKGPEKPVALLRRRVSALSLGALLLLCGCGTYTTPPPETFKSLTPQERNFEAVWQASLNVLRKYRFEIDRQDRRRGEIVTRPMISRHFFEFWRRDARSEFDLAEGALHTVYVVARVSVTPAERPPGRFVSSVTVHRMRSSLQEAEVTASSEARYLLSPRSAPEEEEEEEEEEAETSEPTGQADTVGPGMVSLGRDRLLEEKLTYEIRQAVGVVFSSLPSPGAVPVAPRRWP